jgi:hypothetical protein
VLLIAPSLPENSAVRDRNSRQTLFLLGCVALGLASVGVAIASSPPAIVSEGGASSVWRPAPDVPKVLPGYPSTAVDQSEDACVSIGYLLNKDGTTSDFSLLKVWGDKTQDSVEGRSRLTPFAQMGMAAVQRWKFVAAQTGHAEIKPIYTAASFAFSNNPGSDKEQLRKHCVIEDLSDFIAQEQAAAYRRGNLNKGRMDRARNMNPPIIPPRVGGN